LLEIASAIPLLYLVAKSSLVDRPFRKNMMARAKKPQK
jgi:hypothetical protein